MTWILKHTRSDRPMIAEYLCPVHGRFELEVARDENGDPPDEQPCPDDNAPGPGASIDYSSAMDLGLPEGEPELCSLPSPFAISASGYAKVKAVEAVRGGYQKAERETWTDTTNLGEGQDLDDWEDDRAKVWERERERQVMEMAREL